MIKDDSIKVEVGQVWADNDKRSGVRRVRVVEVSAQYCFVLDVGGTRRRILLTRMRPTSTGYRLVRNADGSAA